MSWSKASLTEIAEQVSTLLACFPSLADTPVVPGSHHQPPWRLQDLPVPIRAVNALGRVGVLDVPGLVGLTWSDLLNLRALGLKTLLDLTCALEYLLPRAHLLTSLSPAETAAALADTVREHDNRLRAVLAQWEADPLVGGATIGDYVDVLLDQGNDSRDAIVLRRRLGLDGAPAQTLAELGAAFSVTPERIRQIEDRSFRRLSRAHARHPDSALMAEVLRGRCSVDDAIAWVQMADQVWPGASPESGLLLRRLAHYESPARLSWRKEWRGWAQALSSHRRAVERDERRQQTEGRYLARRQSRFDRILSGAAWPSNTRAGIPALRGPIREVGVGNGTGLQWSSSKLGRIVACESPLEAEFYALCDQVDQVVWYTEQPVRIRYAYGGGEHQYFPDALVALRDGRLLLVEIKPLFQAALASNQAKWAAAWRWCAQHGVGLVVADHYTSIAEWLARPPASPVTTAAIAAATRDIRGLLRRGPLYFDEILMLRREYGFSSVELSRMALREGWVVHIRPWRLEEAELPLDWLPKNATLDC